MRTLRPCSEGSVYARAHLRLCPASNEVREIPLTFYSNPIPGTNTNVSIPIPILKAIIIIKKITLCTHKKEIFMISIVKIGKCRYKKLKSPFFFIMRVKHKQKRLCFLSAIV